MEKFSVASEGLLLDFSKYRITEKTFALLIDLARQADVPGWRYRRTFYEDQNLGEIGWKVMISRDPERYNDDWKRASDP